MSNFNYKAKKNPQDIVSGSIQADNVNDAIARVIRMGYTPVEVVPADGKTIAPEGMQIASFAVFQTKRVPRNILSLFTRQLGDLIDAGVPLLRALSVLSKQKNHPSMKAIIDRIHNTVRDGGSLSKALSEHPQTFSSLYVNMVKTGEVTGRLQEILERLAVFLEKELEMRSKIISSLMYPLVILGVGFLTIFVLISFVIPRLTVLFEDFDAALPLPTLIVMGMSGFLSQYWWIVVAVIAGVFLYLRYLWNSERGRLWLDRWLLSTPLLGDFIRESELAYFSRTLGTMVENGVDIVSALGSTSDVVQNRIVRSELADVTRKVREGTSLSQAIAGCSIFSEMAVNMIFVGEESGHIEKGLFKLADICERQTEMVSKNLITLFGPFILVVIVAFVGFVVIAMLLPIFQMNLIVS